MEHRSSNLWYNLAVIKNYRQGLWCEALFILLDYTKFGPNRELDNSIVY